MLPPGKGVGLQVTGGGGGGLQVGAGLQPGSFPRSPGGPLPPGADDHPLPYCYPDKTADNNPFIVPAGILCVHLSGMGVNRHYSSHSKKLFTKTK